MVCEDNIEFLCSYNSMVRVADKENKNLGMAQLVSAGILYIQGCRFKSYQQDSIKAVRIISLISIACESSGVFAPMM